MSEEKETAEVVEETVQEGATTKETNKKGLIIGIIVAVVVVALVVGGIIAFGGSAKKLEGNYSLVEMTEGGETYEQEDLQTLEALGLTVSLELKADGTGTLNLFGDTEELTYDGKNITINGESAPYKVDGKRITLEQDEDKLVFEKSE